MKKEFISELKKIAISDKKVFFLTGDLGFNAFENIQELLGERFVNAGVAEQNMVSVAAGLASMGIKPWVYSISTFLTLKTVEQVRNDICLLNIPVKLVGFGGGYGYGIMGETHHLLEDLAIYSSFPRMRIYVPAFSEDIIPIVRDMHGNNVPSYLRLNIAPSSIIKIPKYAPVRHIKKGKKITIIVLGVLVHNVISALSNIGKDDIADVFCVTELPFNFSKKMKDSLKLTKKLMVIEEHAGTGGLGEKVFSFLAKNRMGPESFAHIYAKGYPSGLYGDHLFHQKESQLDPSGILKNIKKILK